MHPSIKSRRAFLSRLGILGVSSTVLSGGLTNGLAAMLQHSEPTDEEICQVKFVLATKRHLHDKPIGEVVATVGTMFLETPYVANTLEVPGDEHLVINLHGLDCVTFVENTLAISRCIKLRTNTFEAYKQQLQRIRYRSGAINGYPSRLHYFSDWIDDNEGKNIVRNISREVGLTYPKQVDFMSSHPSSYKQLGNESYLERIKETEATLDRRQHYYIPKNRISDVESQIKPGDIIAITTSIEGLDVVHTGIAIRSGGILKYLHAPLSKGKVQISEQSLVKYLAGNKKQTGIMVARPLEPGR